MTEAEATVTVGGRAFHFQRITIEKLIEMNERNFEQRFAQMDFQKIIQGGEEYLKFQNLWEIFCDLIFIKDRKWRFLSRFGWMPVELRFSSVTIDDISGVLKSFFEWQGVSPLPQKPQQSSSNVSK